jgi:hypothetical protein
MIGQFEHSKKGTGYPCKNENNFDQIVAMYISFDDYSFANDAAFVSTASWNTGMKSKSLMQLLDLQEIDNNSEEAIYNTDDQDIEIQIYKGKYKFLFRSKYRLDYHQLIQTLSEAPCKVFFQDVNNNVYGTYLGSAIHGLTVELLAIEKKTFGKDVAWTQIKLNLLEPDEFDINGAIGATDFRPTDINLIFCDMTIIGETSTTLQFTVVDSQFGIEISGLTAEDFSLDDDLASLTITSLTEIAFGEYLLVASGQLNTGNLILDTNQYYSVAQYIVTEVTVTFSNYAFETIRKFKVDINYSVSGTPYTGLVLADFTMTDNTNGAVTITSVDEVSSGRYEIITTTDLTSGDISVDDSVVTGTDEYFAIIDVYASNFELNGTTANDIYSVKFEVREVITDNLVEDLLIAAFTFTDEVNGTLSKSSFAETTGVYSMLVIGRVKGVLTMSQGVYAGASNYDYSTQALILNGKGVGTTDFVDTDENGLADFFKPSQTVDGILFEVKTATGLSGMNQYVKKIVANSNPMGIGTFANINIGSTYKLRIKWYATNFGSGADRFVSLYVTDFENQLVNHPLDTIGLSYPSTFESTFVAGGLGMLDIRMLFSKYNATLIINSIELIEV